MKIHPLALLAGLLTGIAWLVILGKWEGALLGEPSSGPVVEVEPEPWPPKASFQTVEHDGHWFVRGYDEYRPHFIHHPDCPVEKEFAE